MAIGDLIITDTKLGVGTTDNLSTLTVRPPVWADDGKHSWTIHCP